MDFFPIFVDLEHRNILIVGGGKIAFRKFKTLKNYCKNIRLISKEFISDFQEYFNQFDFVQREFNLDDLEGSFLVIASTNDEKLNLSIYKHCEEKNILCNNISSKKDMSVRFGAMLQTEGIDIAISTQGSDVKKAVRIRDKIKKKLEES